MADDALGARLLSIFVEELGEQVQELNEHLLALERAPGDAASLGGAFRVMHTLKGASRAAGVLEVETLCHLLESDLARARDSASPLGGAALALLFAAADALADARERLARGTALAGGPIEAVLQQGRWRGEPLRSTGSASRATPVSTPEQNRSPSVATRIAAAPSNAPANPAAVAATPLVEKPAPGEPTAPARPALEQNRDELVRVGMHHVDAISNAAGEVIGLAAVLGERADDLAAMRQRVREQRLRPEYRDDPTLAQVEREMTRLLRRAGDDARTLDSVSGRLSATARRLRQRSLRELMETLPRIVRNTAHDVGKDVHFVVTGEEIEADRIVVEALREPLLHLVRNAVDHGIETAAERLAAGKPEQGTIRVDITLRGDRLRLAVADDGRGLDLNAIRRALQQRGRTAPSDPASLRRTIFEEGLSTREHATTLSGRGVGLGIVRVAVERVGGTVDVSSIAGQGTTFLLEVPLSIATLRAITVQVGDTIFGIPSAFVRRVDRVNAARIARVDGRSMLTTGGAPTPVTTLAALLGPPFTEPPLDDAMQIVTVEIGGRTLGLVVDDLRDERELVLRPLEHAGVAASAVTVGTALLGNGDVVLVLGVAALISEGASGVGLAMPTSEPERLAPHRVLVVDDSMTSRALEQSVLAAAGYDVVTAVDGLEGWRVIERGGIALVVSDVEMPHLDGIGLCERIRASSAWSSLPVILVTSLDKPAERARGLEAGADAYVAKSGFDQEMLLDTVRQLLGQPQKVTA